MQDSRRSCGELNTLVVNCDVMLWLVTHKFLLFLAVPRQLNRFNWLSVCLSVCYHFLHDLTDNCRAILETCHKLLPLRHDIRVTRKHDLTIFGKISDFQEKFQIFRKKIKFSGKKSNFSKNFRAILETSDQRLDNCDTDYISGNWEQQINNYIVTLE